MARQRMYVFERAYRDYSALLRSSGSKVSYFSRGIWDWFWDGFGAVAIEFVLRVAVLGSAAWAAWAYFNYESSHGRGFSFGMLIAIFAVFGYAFLLLWAWKTPVQIVTRGVSSVSASGLVIILALAGLLIATAFFAPYLLLLFGLTLLSFLVFVPMRFANWVWLQTRKITYKCPYDDCRHRGLPIHICSCGVEYKDLQPSFYGIFNHKCRHGDRDVKLPTLIGRGRLPRMCAGCKRPLLHSSLGELREWPVFIVGGPGAGKSIFLTQAVRGLASHFSSLPAGIARLDSEAQQQEFDRQAELLDRGEILAKTAGMAMHALGLAVRVPKKLRCLMYFFDKPGEYFETMQKFGQLQGVEGLKGIVLLIDPFSLPELAAQTQLVSDALNASETALPKVVASLINAVDMTLLQAQPNQACTVPLAVVIGKIDAFDAQTKTRFSFLDRIGPSPSPDQDEQMSALCRNAILKLGDSTSIRNLELKFSNIHYFACTALGRMPDFANRSPFQPKGVTEPFLWLIGAAAQPASGKARKLASLQRAAM